jgi:hypothetical protein
MSNDTAPQVNGSQSPVTLLAQVLRELIQREQEIDRMEVTQETDQDQIETYRRCNQQAIEGVERVMACLAAAHPKEAVVQVLVAAGQLNSIDTASDDVAWLPERLETAVQLAFAVSVTGVGGNDTSRPHGVRDGALRYRGATVPVLRRHKEIGSGNSPDAV